MIERSIHPNTKVLIDAWKRIQANPDTSEPIGPNANEHIDMLERIFVLQMTADHHWTFRVVSSGVTSLLGRDMTDHDFMSLWSGPDRQMMSAFTETVRLEGSPGVIRARGETLTGQRADLEITLMPIAPLNTKNSFPRMIGLYQTLGGEGLLKGRPVWRHRISMLSPPETKIRTSHLRLVSNNS